MGLRLSPFLPVFVLATLSAIPPLLHRWTLLSRAYISEAVKVDTRAAYIFLQHHLVFWSLTIVIVVGYFARIIDWTFRCPENGGMLKTGLLHVGEFAGQNRLVIINKH